MAIKLTNNVNLTIEDASGKVLKSFDVTFREMTKKEARKLPKAQKDAMEIYGEVVKISRRIETLEKKLEALSNDNEIVATSQKLEKLYDRMEKLEAEADKIGEDNLDKATKAMYKKMVGGKDADELWEYAQENLDMEVVYDALREEVKEAKGKPSGK